MRAWMTHVVIGLLLGVVLVQWAQGQAGGKGPAPPIRASGFLLQDDDGQIVGGLTTRDAAGPHPTGHPRLFLAKGDARIDLLLLDGLHGRPGTWARIIAAHDSGRYFEVGLREDGAQVRIISDGDAAEGGPLRLNSLRSGSFPRRGEPTNGVYLNTNNAEATLQIGSKGRSYSLP